MKGLSHTYTCIHSPVAQQYRVSLQCRRLEIWVQSLGREDSPLEEEMTAHSSILAGKILWTEVPGGLQPMGSQRVGHD